MHGYPLNRMRRNRQSDWSRRLVCENNVSTSDLILPVFVMEGDNKIEPINSLPGVNRYTIDRIIEVAKECEDNGLPLIAIFPVIDSGKEVHLNLSQVQYMDSSGISVLIESHQRALEKNTKVIIKDVSKSVLKVIMMAKLEQILNLE